MLRNVQHHNIKCEFTFVIFGEPVFVSMLTGILSSWSQDTRCGIHVGFEIYRYPVFFPLKIEKSDLSISFSWSDFAHNLIHLINLKVVVLLPL